MQSRLELNERRSNFEAGYRTSQIKGSVSSDAAFYTGSGSKGKANGYGSAGSFLGAGSGTGVSFSGQGNAMGGSGSKIIDPDGRGSQTDE